MTSKEALKILKANAILFDDGTDFGASMLEAITVLDKYADLEARDTPMKPIKLKWENTENYYYVCPKCEELVARTDEVFCQDCGQRLDWSY